MTFRLPESKDIFDAMEDFNIIRKQAIERILGHYTEYVPYNVSKEQTVDALELLAEGADPVEVVKAIDHIAQGAQMFYELDRKVQQDRSEHEAQIAAEQQQA